MKEEMYRSIIHQIKALPQKSLPDDFTAGVMVQLSKKRQPGRWMPLARLFEKHPKIGTRVSMTKTECAIPYIMTGLFYGIVGGILMVVVNNCRNEQIIKGWIMIQPFFLVAISFMLLSMGIAIYFAGRPATPFVKAGALLFIAAFLLDCLFSSMHPYHFVSYLSIMLTSTAAIIGLLLYRNVVDYSRTHNQGGA